LGVALLLVWLLDRDPFTTSRLTIVNLTLLFLSLGATWVCLRYGRHAEAMFGNKDPQSVVADEVAGQALVLIGMPWRSITDPNGWGWNLGFVAIAFVAFRVMDIWKPPPAARMQSLPGGLGIVIDDLIAGIYALVITQIVVRLIL